MKHVLRTLEKVGNIELFYDLIFAYIVAVVTGLLHGHGAFFTFGHYLTFSVAALVAIQVWFNTTFLVNRYGDGSLGDSACMFTNMFCLYFMAEALGHPGGVELWMFNLSWAAIIVNLIVHWRLKVRRYVNVDEADRRIIDSSVRILAAQLAILVLSFALPFHVAQHLTAAALVVGMAFWATAFLHDLKPTNFDHLAERCCLLVIVVFGEMVAGIANYVHAIEFSLAQVGLSLLVFTLVVGLFLVYDYEYEHLLDHGLVSDGTGLMLVHSLVVFILQNLAAALEYLSDFSGHMDPQAQDKVVFLMVGLVLYLIATLLVSVYNRPIFQLSGSFVLGRLLVCLLIVVVSVASGFNPVISLVADTVLVYATYLHQRVLFTRRTRLVELSEHLGLSREELSVLGYSSETRQGRERIARLMEEGPHMIEGDEGPHGE